MEHRYAATSGAAVLPDRPVRRLVREAVLEPALPAAADALPPQRRAAATLAPDVPTTATAPALPPGRPLPDAAPDGGPLDDGSFWAALLGGAQPVLSASASASARPAAAGASGASARPAAALMGMPGPRLPPAELAVLAALAQRRRVAQGEMVLHRATPAGSLVALRSGEVALGLRDAEGGFRTERIVRGPAWLDQSSAWADGRHALDALAQSAAEVVELPREALKAQLGRYPVLAQGLIHGLACEVQALTANTHELMHKDAPARLAQWLHLRCEPLAGLPQQGVVRLHERKRDVASQLAITPETLSRLMRQFSQQGVIEVSGYTLRVLDADALARLAQG